MQVVVFPRIPARSWLALAACLLLAVAAAAPAQPTDQPQQQLRWQREVRAAECSFAASMARRDLAAFERHLSPQTLFFGSTQRFSGAAAVVAGWKGFFDGPTAPFSWEPDQVVVNLDGSLAFTTGLVRDEKGELSARFNSVWRQEAPGRWRVVIDKGQALSAADRAAPQPAGQGCAGMETAS